MKAFKQCTAIKQCRTPQNMFLPSRHTFPKSLTGKQEQGLADDLLGPSRTTPIHFVAVAMHDCSIEAGSWKRLKQSWYSKNKEVKVEILKKLYLAFE